MSLITAIEKTRFYLLVTLDDGTQLRLNKRSLTDIPLQEGMELEPEEYMNRLAAKQYPRAMEAALYALEGGDKTESRMREYLRRHYYPAECVDAVLEKLKAQRLIDDKRYALRYAENHPEEGKYALQRKLRARGIGLDEAQLAAATLDDEAQLAACRKEAEKLARRYSADEPRDRKRKMSQALARRGFGWEMISRALGDEEDMWEEQEGILW